MFNNKLNRRVEKLEAELKVLKDQLSKTMGTVNFWDQYTIKCLKEEGEMMWSRQAALFEHLGLKPVDNVGVRIVQVADKKAPK